MDKNFKKQEVDDNLELKEILEKQDPENVNKDFMIHLLTKLKISRKIGHKEIAKMILFMADFPERNWNIKNIMEVLKSNLEEINWRDVYSCFLEEEFTIWSLDSLYVIIDCWVCISGIITVPYEIFFKKWKNLRSQIYFIRLIIESDEKKTQLYSNVFFTKILKQDETRMTRYKNNLNYESTFNCVELFECIKSLDSNILIEQISKKAPEWCAAGLSYIYPHFEKFLDDLIINFLRGSSNNFIFYILFRNIPKILLKKLSSFISQGISLSKILDVILEHKMLPQVSEDLDPPNICLDIIILSSVRDHLNLGIWIQNNLNSKKDQFAKILINYLEIKIQEMNLNQNEIRNDKSIENINREIKDMNLNNRENLMIDKLFPLTVEILINIVKSIEQNQNKLAYETLTKFNNLKKQIPLVIKLKKGNENNVDEQASSFISSIINSQLSIQDGLEYIKNMQNGDTNMKDLSYKIFTTLIENYQALYKLPNSDLLAIFYGELIKNLIIPKAFLKISLKYLKDSLAFPETEREFHFAFKCLEKFIRTMPKFLEEIENIENVKKNLLKKDLILVDETFYSRITFNELIETSLKINITNEFINIEQKISSENLNSANLNDLIFGIFFNLYKEETPLIFKFLNNLNQKISANLLISSLQIVNSLLNLTIEKETEFIKKLGKLVGNLTLAKNRIIILDKFDFKKFLIKSVEGRRIKLGIFFISSFLKEGKKGKIFIPKNPWLMSILNLLGNLQTCTLKEIRKEIEELFKYFEIEIKPKEVEFFKFRSREYLLEYKIQLNNTKDITNIYNNKEDLEIFKHAVFLALDFSIREIAEAIIDKACEISIKTGMKLFKSIKIEKGKEFVLFRNLLVNLTKSLCFVSAQEPIRACMSGNISYFLKLVNLEINPEEIHKIVNDNQEICINLIQRAATSKISDCVNEYFKNTEINEGTGNFINLKILENNSHLEKINIKPIEASEFQELKSHFLQISRRKTGTMDFISEEWHNLIKNNKEEDFEKIKKYILKSEDKDLECTKLCKYLIGHLIKNSSHKDIKNGHLQKTEHPKRGEQDTTSHTRNNSDMIFIRLKDIFNISNRTQKEVQNWIIYSNDTRKYNEKFISKFIEFQLINLVEFDQALARNIKNEENLEEILNLISNLITGDIQICTVYDFIASLESLANFSDNSKIYDFFQKISSYMFLFENSNLSEFEEFIKSEKYSIFTDYKKIRNLPQNLNIKSAFKSSWEHFVRHHKLPTLFCYQKVDLIPQIIKNTISLYIKDTLEVFIDAYNRRNYLFIKFYTRFIIKLLDILDESSENLKIIYDLLNLLKPSSVPFFTTGYLEIMQHKFVKRLFDFNMAEEILKVLNVNEKFIYPCTKIFMNIKDNKNFLKVYGIYLSYICNYKYIHLRNIFNRYRDNIQYLENQNLYFKIRRMLQSNTIVLKDFMNNSTFILCIIDNLNEKNLISVYANNILRNFINEKILVNKIITLVWIYNKCECVPLGLKMFYEELKKNEWVVKIIDSLESKFNK
ncbi:general negative regulator of transcription subunit 1 CDC39 (CDC39) [Vairimorpha necatrix]|uniref:General negative regulator of transcription subunit 1 CDC39 (CDC39) n=1 Tax=Vairimorpha necatrix TaxID=6039 RepID=A0AAX4J8M9_9MICR